RYAYTYEPETRAGEIETLGAFTVSEDFLTMTFTRYNGAIPDAVFENSGAAIARALWVWEQSVLQFGPIKASLNGALYPYSFDSATRTGTIEKIGQFTLAEDGASITVTQFRRAAYDLVFEKASAKPAWTGSLIGTSWGWQNGFNGWMVFEFMNETEVILIFTESTYHSDTPEVYAYTYNRQSQSGNIPTQGPFALTNGNKVLWFSQWRAYPHGAEYTRIE
ncbi:MAG: hypothetical protein LBD24_02960, partial [Spirochaetaceae bacterium]|nr:hypothetical protein [Spirochaetaceae bacterium]